MSLSTFLVKAKKNTYASVGEGSEERLEDSSKELIYEESDFKYRDRYFGSLYKDKKVYELSYHGGVIKK